MVAAAIVGTTIVGGIVASEAQSNAASSAANAQQASSAASIAEQRRQFNALQKLLQPYSDAGLRSLTAQQNLIGLNGNSAQATAIRNLTNSSQFAALANQGEQGILQNASATGGLRGGNTQAALAQFRPQLLNQLINEQYTKLGGITSIGQNASAMSGNAGMQSANNISNLLQQSGAAQAGNYLAQGQAQANLWSGLGSSVGMYYGLRMAGF